MKRLLIGILCLVAVLPEIHSAKNHPIEWPPITKETKPWTRWWWFGSAVNEQDLTAALEAYQKAGLGGVEITPIYGVRGEENRFIDFLSPKWMKMFTHTLQEAKRLGVGVDLANASGWPFGGPWIDESTASKNMVSKVYNLQGGQTLTEAITYVQQPLVRMQSNRKVSTEEIKYPLSANQPRQEYAFDQVRYKKELPLVAVTAHLKSADGYSKSIDLTNKIHNGKLEWTAPQGDWTICALFMGDHGKMVERAGPGGEGWVIDHFSNQALNTYLHKFDEAFKGQDISYLRYYFNDSYEVDDASGQANWTPEFFAEFRKLQGYDLKEYLPALLGLNTQELNSRVLYDYRMTISQLLFDKYTMPWQQWAAKQGKGIRNQSHGSPANVLDLYAISDIPEVEGRDIACLKFAPSAAHVTGKKLTSSESCTWLGEHFQSTLGDAKTCIDQFLLAGVNHNFYHGTSYSPQNAAWPGWLFYAAEHFTPANTTWEDFGALNQYVARAQSFLQAGRPANDILLYCPVSDFWSAPAKRGILQHIESGNFFNGLPDMEECGRFMLQNGYAWDAISDKQLLGVACNNSSLLTGGNSYQTIVMPQTELIPVETFQKLISLAKEGATILFHKSLPADVPGLSNLETNRKALNELKKQLTFTKGNNVQVASYGKGKIVLSDDLAALTSSAHIKPESIVASGLQCIRRIKEDGNFYYFINNPGEKAFDGWITLNVPYSSAALYNPMTGVAGYAKTRKNGELTEIYIQFKPDESFIIETFKVKSEAFKEKSEAFNEKFEGEVYPFYKEAGNTQTLHNEWTITFVKGGPALPDALKTKQLTSWTNYGPAYQAFSGTAEYVTRIPQTSSQAEAWLLNVDKVNASASVYINGTYIGTLLNAPYSIEIPGTLLKGNDELKIRVSNLMANRIANLDKRDVEWRKFYNTNFNARIKTNVGRDGKFSAATWDAKDSGLCGTVTLTPLTLIK